MISFIFTYVSNNSNYIYASYSSDNVFRLLDHWAFPSEGVVLEKSVDF